MKILCIDGGGIRGILPVTILKAIEKDLKKPIGESFDLVAGTSTGAIIAASIALRKRMEDVLHFYQMYGEKIFTRQAKVGLFKSVYSDRDLRHMLRDVFKEVKLADVEQPLLIPSVDITHGKPFTYRSHADEADKGVSDIFLWDAVLSSCSAPVYFPPNNISQRYLSIDGGLWANNPSMAAITEAIKSFNTGLEEVNVLSFGTGKQKIEFSFSKNKYWGLRQWMPLKIPSLKTKPKLLDLALHLSSESVSYQSQLLLGERYLRIDEDLSKEIPFDDILCMEELMTLGERVYDQHKEKILQFLF
ncbi:patatin [Halobacillus andaensis]|uniref:Patatin n=1 Tax=Halobacillus andaensis TaxID=1176239 RepID=A0A917B5W2_HALAA|nr:CBASS cGAMP-activated phospholipase [Halobacillus andaensis]MBP2005820.1 patatin-like phospholipase/acyl hydrolase [Halobacillus andaensis]GGF25816.1 patatin [Halobacillus andaensis]